MIISRTPFRVSFLGGGTDYPVWYEQHGGAVLASTIDKYCYITCRHLPPFFEHKSRIVYSSIENVFRNDEIRHPAVREALRTMGIREGMEIHHDGDLPARSGLGSSSSFTVGLLHSLFALKRTMPTKMQLAVEAIKLEREILAESVGSQDQISASFGGFNKIEFLRDGRIVVNPVIIDNRRLESFQRHLLLFFTGLSRSASEIAAEQIRQTASKETELARMQGMVDEGLAILTGAGSLDDFGRLLDEAWALKRRLTDKIATPEINAIYDAALSAGALGGKLLGAGGGGFMLIFARPSDHARIRFRLKELLAVPFKFETGGSQIIFYEPNMSIESASVRADGGLSAGISGIMSRFFGRKAVG